MEILTAPATASQVVLTDLLYIGTGFFVLAAIVTAFLIRRTLQQKMRNSIIKQGVKTVIDPWISKALLEEEQEDVEELITDEFRSYLKQKRSRQHIITKLVNSKKHLTGAAAENIVRLYETLELKKDSLEKFYSTHWQQKALGIYELYMMNQADMLDEILAYTNSENEYIKTEAQTAAIGFMGFDGLQFLDKLTQPLTNWHQIKILEQLKTFESQELKGLQNWLMSENEYVVLFALKLAEIHQQGHAYKEVVLCLESPNEKIRAQAIQALSRMPKEDTASTLVAHFPAENKKNQKAILRCMATVSHEDELVFLQAQLRNKDDDIKLEAARALLNTKNGEEILKEMVSRQPQPFEQIYLHVKSKFLA
jgi:hypothetical protein